MFPLKNKNLSHYLNFYFQKFEFIIIIIIAIELSEEKVEITL